MQQAVYWNLHKRLYSVQTKRHDDNQWRVSNHYTDVYLLDADFKVSEAGRQRVLATGKKNVHAKVVGEAPTILSLQPWQFHKGREVTYNPFKGPTFVYKDTGEPVHHADYVKMETQETRPYYRKPRIFVINRTDFAGGESSK